MKRVWFCAALAAVTACEDGDDEVVDASPTDAGNEQGPGDAAAEAGTDGSTDGSTDASPEGGSDGELCTPPDSGLYAVFDVNGERFRAHITDEDAIEDALALWFGASSPSIPNGVLVCEPAEFNCDYSWHLEPGSLEFADATIEVCDGAPSYIEENCSSFVDRYCPWSATLYDLRDCRVDGCPAVLR